MSERVEKPQLDRLLTRRVIGWGSSLMLAATLFTGCTLNGKAESGTASSLPGPATPTPPVAACESLNIRITDEAKHEIEVTPTWTTGEGVLYAGTTYIFGKNTSSVTETSQQNPTGTITHEFPIKPTTQIDEVIAVTDYVYLGEDGVFDSPQTCRQDVSFKSIAGSLIRKLSS